MKRINIAYWIITALFSAFMILSSIGGLLLTQEAVDYLHIKMGYPLYFIQMISVAKILGAIAILLPMLPSRVKEWAYFGLFIYLMAALISFIAINDPVSIWAPMILFIAVLLVAYWLHHKRLSLRAITNN